MWWGGGGGGVPVSVRKARCEWLMTVRKAASSNLLCFAAPHNNRGKCCAHSGCVVILETMCFAQHWIISSLGRFSDPCQVLRCFNRVSAVVVDGYTPAYSGGPCFIQVWQHLTANVLGETHRKDQSLVSRCCCFWRILFPSIWTLFSRYLAHFLTHVFSSPPFFRLPQSLEFAAGQKAAAEAQPIWNAAPPFWRSERKEGTRLDVKPGAKSTSCLHAQQNDGTALIYSPATSEGWYRSPVWGGILQHLDLIMTVLYDTCMKMRFRF